VKEAFQTKRFSMIRGNAMGLIDAFIAAGLPVVSTPIVFSPDYSELERPVGILAAIKEFGAFRRGTTGGETISQLKSYGEEITELPGKRGLNAFSVGHRSACLIQSITLPRRCVIFDQIGFVQGPNGLRLMPRTSFEIWKETVRSQSNAWLSFEVQAARRLRFALREIVVDHAEKLSALNRQLAMSNEELDSFAYVASHDLKEPLRGILHYAQYLIEACSHKIDEVSHNRLQSLMRLTRRMDALINSLLHYSRVGRLDLVLNEVDLNEVIAEVFELLEASRPDSKVELRVPKPLPTVRGDHVLLRELYLNLVGNAMKYNDKPQPWVEIGFLVENDESVYSVRDNGIGIPSNFHEQIFKMFKRLHGRNEYGGGSGAGLTICRKIVERHGGRIWTESEPGHGATFFFTLGLPRSK
jgi:two-component system, chemotaxis family, sensor kinase Cph1